jgi:hypothetical protein
VIGGVRRQAAVFFEDVDLQGFVKFMIKPVLEADGVDEGLFQIGPANFFGDDEIVLQENVTLGLFRLGAQTELFDLFDEEPRHTDDIDVEHGMLGYGAVTHLEDDVAV